MSGAFDAYAGPIYIDLVRVLAEFGAGSRDKAHSILPAFTGLMDQWLNQILDMSRELIIANRLAVVTKTLVKECIAEARLFRVSLNRSSRKGALLDLCAPAAFSA